MRIAAAAALALALAAGCGEDPESDPLAPERPPERAPEANGLSQDDAAMARTVATYFERNATGTAFYDEIERVSVREGVITVETTLRLSGRLEGAARDICDLIQGSDEADFTPGHSVTGRGPKVVCPHRTE
ncbi:MAG TPA: hypothetical protein VHF45_04850 [Thermoleophilaceae bacterium]|nr:hypothetical protein [Thermoleophilaceae bacterium]